MCQMHRGAYRNIGDTFSLLEIKKSSYMGIFYYVGTIDNRWCDTGENKI